MSRHKHIAFKNALRRHNSNRQRLHNYKQILVQCLSCGSDIELTKTIDLSAADIVCKHCDKSAVSKNAAQQYIVKIYDIINQQQMLMIKKYL
jgi:transcription elongation factor Elf1